MQLLQTLPANVMTELKSACRAAPAPAPGMPPGHIKPAAAAALALEADPGQGPGGRRGTLVVDVYIWTLPGAQRT
jgi:hypothetical protein